MKYKTNSDGSYKFDSNGQPEVEFDGSSIRFAVGGLEVPQVNNKTGRLIKKLDTHKYPTIQEVKEYGMNIGVSEGEVRAIEAGMIKAITAALTGRRFCPPTYYPGSTTKVTYTRLTHMSEAEVVGPGQPIPTDYPTEADVHVHPQKLAKGSVINREQGLTTQLLQNCIWSITQQVAELENNIIFNSLTLPDVDGLIDDKGNTDAGTAAWSGAPGTSKPFTDIQDLTALMMADGFMPPYLLGVEAVNWGEGSHRLENAGDGGLEMVKASGLVTDIVVDPHIPHGTAVMVKVNPAIATLFVCEDMTIIIGGLDTLTQTIPVTCHEIVAPAILQPNGVGTETGL